MRPLALSVERMAFEGLSSSVIIALAAVLWLAYLVPTWFKRREYLSTERNAVRLQQTLRILAETAEVPDQVRVENSARSVAAQEKLMQREMQRTQAIQRAQDAAAARAAVRTLAETQPAIAADVARSSASSRRLRRSRLVSTLVLVAAVIGVAFGGAQLAAGAGFALLAGASVVAVGAIVLLRQLSAVSRTRAQLAAGLERPVRVSTPVQDLWEQQSQVQAAPVREEWTPVEVPKPLYLSRPEAPAAPRVSFADAAARLSRITPDSAVSELREASQRSELVLREAQDQTARLVSREQAPAVAEQAAPAGPTAVPAAPAEPTAPSRFARMGVIDEAELAPANLDEALRRRRAV